LPRGDSALRLEVNRALTQVYIGDIETIFNQWLGALGRPSDCSPPCTSSMSFRNSKTAQVDAYNACAAGLPRFFYGPHRPRADQETLHVETLLTQCRHRLGRRLFVLFASAVQAQSEQQKLVAMPTSAFEFPARPRHEVAAAEHQPSRALIIAPEILKAGFIFGGSGGPRARGRARSGSGKWVGPAFYVLATGSVGFQAGISVSEGVTMVMTEKGFNSLLATIVQDGRRRERRRGPGRRGRKERHRRRPHHVQSRQGSVRRPQLRRHRRHGRG
jgi:hypothetical protein